MTRDESDRRLGRLLAGRDQPSVLEREAAFDQIVEAVAPAPRSAWWPKVAIAFGASAALAAAFVLVPRTDEFGTKGPGAASFRVHCVKASKPAPCTPNSKLLVQVTAPTKRPHFGLLAVRSDETAIWYMPEETGVTSKVAPGAEVLLRDGFVLNGAQHPPGSYVVHGIFSAKPLDRAAIRSAFDDPPDDVELVQRPLTIEQEVP